MAGNRAVNAKLVELLFPFFFFFYDVITVASALELNWSIHGAPLSFSVSFAVRRRPTFSDLILLRTGKNEQERARRREKAQIEGRRKSEEDKWKAGDG